MSTHNNNEIFQALTFEEKKFMLPSPFRRKTEALDWKKIASIDIDKIIQTSNIELLEEFFGQITHCRPEIEFETSSDSGFLKVFKLCQLMIEYFHGCEQAIEQKYEKMALKCTQAEEQISALSSEVQTLKDNLSAAKKELRRRKELLVTAQNEVVGDNRDEYDPCPYCSKRFLTTSYLIAHMQRRHQGLPFQPPFPAQNIFHGFSPKYVENDFNPKQISPGQPPASAQNTTLVNTPGFNQQTQTEKMEAEVVPLPSAEMITALIEKCLLEKSALKNMYDIPNPKFQSVQVQVDDPELKKEPPAPVEIFKKSSENENSSTKIAEEKNDAGESVKNIMAEIKHQLDLQWQYFSGNIQDNDLEELKSTLVVQSGDTRTLRLIPSPMLSPAHFRGHNFLIADVERNLEPNLPIKSPIHEQVEERFQQQQNELESMKNLLQTKMESDIKTIESKLESQERYWRSKLRLVEEEYNYQLGKLRQEFQVSLQNQSIETQLPATTNISQKPVLDTQDKDISQVNSSEIKPNETGNPPSAVMPIAINPNSSPQIATTSFATRPETIAKMAAATDSQLAKMSAPVIVESPRHSKPEITNSPKKLPVPKPRSIAVTLETELQPVMQQLIAVKSRHEYEEPEEVLKLEVEQVQEYSQSEEEETTDDLSHNNQIILPEKEVGGPSTAQAEGQHEPDVSSRILKLQDQVTQEVNNQLQALGLDPNAPEISAQDMKRISKQFQARRESLQPIISKVEEEQQTMKPQAESAVAQKNIQDRLDSIGMAVTPEKASKSPLIKVLTAVRMSGRKMQKRVKSAITKTPKPRKSPTLPTSAKSSKGGFFSRARWGRGKKSPPNVNKEIPPNDKALEETSSSSEYTESDESSSESDQDVEVHYIPKDKLPISKTSTPVKVKPDTKEIEKSETESEVEDIPASPHKKIKTSTMSRKASTLRNKEAVTNKIVRKETLKKELKQKPSFKKPVRRSLDAEFDQVTPKKVLEHVSHSQSEDPSTGDEISSSWEEEERKEDAGEHVHLTPLHDTVPRQIRQASTAIQDSPEEKFRKDTLPNKEKGSKYNQDEKNGTAGHKSAGGPTTRPRIALDSWDAEDDDDLKGKPSFVNKPTLVSHRWNDEPLYSNNGGRRTPMSMITTEGNVVKAKNSTEHPPKVKQNEKAQRDSPLNNSWDSN